MTRWISFRAGLRRTHVSRAPQLLSNSGTLLVALRLEIDTSSESAIKRLFELCHLVVDSVEARLQNIDVAIDCVCRRREQLENFGLW
jgi:hypothetical protein